MKGIILAGGTGSRLYPLTKAVNKQLLPVFDKPMIYYPIAKLIECGITDLYIVVNPDRHIDFNLLLSGLELFGVRTTFVTQKEPRGIPEALLLCEEFIENQNVCLILGDNIFFDNREIKNVFSKYTSGALALGIEVSDPTLYGVAEINSLGEVINLSEKPQAPTSNLAIPGFYVFDSSAVSRVKNLGYSGRGELEIIDLLQSYLRSKQLTFHKLRNDSVWFDAGTPHSLYTASKFVQSLDKNPQSNLGYPELAALERGLISEQNFFKLIENVPDGPYKNQLKRSLTELSKT